VEDMIAHAMTLEDGEEKEQFLELICIQMKKNYIAWNKDNVDDKRIINDLYEYTNGAIDLSGREIRISQNTQLRNNTNHKRINNGKKNYKRKF
jgi:hypothetical protein